MDAALIHIPSTEHDVERPTAAARHPTLKFRQCTQYGEALGLGRSTSLAPGCRGQHRSKLETALSCEHATKD